MSDISPHPVAIRYVSSVCYRHSVPLFDSDTISATFLIARFHLRDITVDFPSVFAQGASI